MNAPDGFSLPWPKELRATPEQMAEIRELFPERQPPYRALQDWIIVQERLPRMTTKGGVILTKLTQERDQLDMNIGRIVSVGPRAFFDRDTLEMLPDEERVEVGSIVRIPKFGADRPIEGRIVWRAIKFTDISAVIVDAESILR